MKRSRAGAAAAKRTGPSVQPRPSASGGVDLEMVRELARIATEFDLAEVEASPGGMVRVRRGAVSGPAPLPAAAAAPMAPSAAPLSLMSQGDRNEKPSDDLAAITSPFVGTFYRAPTPDSPPFVDVGATVRKGQVVCIVEAMKLMNEIESDFDGKVAEILVENGEHVEYGQALFRLQKS